MTIEAITLKPTASASGVLRGILARLVQRAGRLWQAHRTRQELHGLPDEVLRDIGVSRCEINFLALSTDAPDDQGWNPRARFVPGLLRSARSPGTTA